VTHAARFLLRLEENLAALCLGFLLLTLFLQVFTRFILLDPLLVARTRRPSPRTCLMARSSGNSENLIAVNRFRRSSVTFFMVLPSINCPPRTIADNFSSV